MRSLSRTDERKRRRDGGGDDVEEGEIGEKLCLLFNNWDWRFSAVRKKAVKCNFYF